MANPTIGDILRVAVAEKLPVSVKYKGYDDQQWFSFDSIDRSKAAELCMTATAIKITFFLP